MDGSVSSAQAPTSAPTAAPAPSPAPAASPAAPAASSAPSRGADGKFAGRQRGELKKRIREGLPPSESNAPVVEVRSDASQDGLQSLSDKPIKGNAAPKETEAPAAPQWTDDPSSWAEPAQKAYAGLQEQYRTEIGKWEDVGRKAVEQNRRLLEEVKFLREQIQTAGVQVDPRDLELLNYRSRDVSAQQMVELQKQRDTYYQQQQRQQEQVQIRRDAEAAVAQMQKLARDRGIDIKAIYSEYKAANAIGESISFEDAASRVLERLEWKQRKVNASAPAPTVSGVSAGTTLPKSRTRDGRLNRLRALGHAV